MCILMNKQNCEARERTTLLASSGYVKTDSSVLVIMIQTAANVKRNTLEDAFRVRKVEIINVILKRICN